MDESGRTGLAGMAARVLLGVLGLAALGACGQRDAVDHVTGWWHDYEGGAIARQRPPPPGAHDAYPHVGLTPVTGPEMPSALARSSLTDRLTAQRNFGARLAAADGPLPHVTQSPPSPTAPAAMPHPVSPPVAAHATTAPAEQPAPSGEGSSMTVAAASSAPTGLPPSGAGAGRGTAGRGPQDAAMPAVTHFAPPPIRPGDLPQIGNAPPPAPSFSGFDIPHTAIDTPRAAPAYALSNPHGALIRFGQSSDQIIQGQERTVSDVLSSWHAGMPVFVTGFGDAASLSPDDQAASLRLAAERARALAQILMQRDVAPGDIHLAAAANGHFGRIGLRP